MKTATLCALVWILAGQAHAEEAQALNRGYARVRPYAGVTPAGFVGEELPARPAGAIADLGVEAQTRSGFLIGFEFAPLTLGAARPQMTGRLQLGYANEQLAIGVGVGSGFTSAYAQVGPVLRIGRYDRTHAHLRVSFSVYPPQPIPSDLDLDVIVPVHRRVRLDINLGGGYGNVIGLYATLGTQVLVAQRGDRAATRLTFGAGVSWVQYTVGPAALVGLEQLF
jgi:hypothetical protein